jgi:hypothetical protein
MFPRKKLTPTAATLNPPSAIAGNQHAHCLEVVRTDVDLVIRAELDSRAQALLG